MAPFDGAMQSKKTKETCNTNDFSSIKTLLIVDDNRLNRKTILIFARNQVGPSRFASKSKRSQNVQTLEASNGREAIDVFTAHPEINCIIMDIKMPILDGIASTKVWRKLRRRSKLNPFRRSANLRKRHNGPGRL